MVSYEDFKVNPYELAREVRALAKEFPDHVYFNPAGIGCEYSHSDGSMGCIIGEGMRRLGKPLPHKDETEYFEIEELVSTGADSLFGWGRVLNEDREADDVTHWLRWVQIEQDALINWSDAVSSADRKFPYTQPTS